MAQEMNQTAVQSDYFGNVHNAVKSFRSNDRVSFVPDFLLLAWIMVQ